MGAFKKFDKSRGGKSFGGSKFGGGRKFGGRGDDRESGPKQLFDATCTECNRDCQVPFRPYSGNPVFCSNCFKKQEGGRGAAGPRKSFGSDAGAGGGITKAQFDVLSMKLDKILSLLRNAGGDDDDFDVEEKKSKKFDRPTGAPVRKARGKRM